MFDTAPRFPAQIGRGDGFSAEVVIRHPCRCQRQLSVGITFTPKGSKTSREQVFKLEVAPGTTTKTIQVGNADLARAKIKPGRYTLSFTLYDEQGRAADPGALAMAGLPFTFGKSSETLAAKPKLPASIGREAELAVAFVFGNGGDIPSDVTALVVFSRPDESAGIEYYKPNLVVPPGGATLTVRLTAAQRRELKIGPGAWLITTSAFDGLGKRLESFPGHLLMIGKVLSMPAAPALNSPIEQAEDLKITLTLKNDGDVPDLVTGVFTFSGPGAPKPIEHKIEGIRVPPGTLTKDLVLTAKDRYNLGIRPGRWKVAIHALDRAGNRIEGRGGTRELMIKQSETAAR